MILYHNDGNEEKKVDFLEDLGIYTHSREIPESPSVSTLESSNLGRRDVFIDRVHTGREITIHLVIAEETAELARKKIAEVNSLLKGKLKAVFKNDTSLLYKDLFLQDVITSEEVTERVYILEVKLKAYNPFRYGVEKKTVTKKVESISFINLENEGNSEAYPVIKLKGSAKTLNISVGDKTFSYSDLREENNIKVDNESFTIEDIYEDGSSLNALGNWRGNFLSLSPGYNEMIISGDRLNLEITVEFRNAYL